MKGPLQALVIRRRRLLTSPETKVGHTKQIRFPEWLIMRNPFESHAKLFE